MQKVVSNSSILIHLAKLDKGEAEVIVLSIEIGADFTLLDDYEARQKARLYGLKITGTLGVLLKAKYKREIKSIKDEIIKLKQTGFRISEQLEYKILQEAGEI